MNEFFSIVSIILSILGLYTSYLAFRKTEFSKFEEDEERLVEFAKANYKQAEHYFNNGKTREELYLDSMFNANFETYHKYSSRKNIKELTGIKKRLFGKDVEKKIYELLEMRKSIYNSRNVIRDAYKANHNGKTPLTQNDIQEMRCILSKYRKGLITNQK